jgi:predicted permease
MTHMALGNGQPDGARRVWGYLVTGNYFQSLGIRPALGRFFTAAEDQHLNASAYAVLSYDCWWNRFAGDPRIAGRDIQLNGRPFRVLGVAPPGFHGTEIFYRSEIWVPMMMQPLIEGSSWLECRGCTNSFMAGRLKKGVSIERAEANLRAVATQLAREYRVHEGMNLSLSPPGLVGSMGRAPTRAFASGVMLLAVLVLLAACFNLAALQTARGVDRDRELGIRFSIGATRGRIVRQLITESLVLSLLGGLAGITLAALVLHLISQWRAPLEFPIQFDVTADWRVFWFAFSTAALTGVLLGVGLARRAWTADPLRTIKGLSLAVRGRRLAMHDFLLPVQIALCCALVTSSLVAVRGMVASLQSPLGFRPDGIAVASYDVAFAGYDNTRGRVFHQRVLEDLARLPGVESAAYSSSVPLSIAQSTRSVYAESTVDFSSKNRFHPIYYLVSPGYFATVGTRLLLGREFTEQDSTKSPSVAIVNQAFARRVMGTPDAVGHRFRDGSRDLIEVVGVVEDGKYETLTEEPKPTVFFPILQSYSSSVILFARTRRPEAELANEMRQLVARHDSNLAVYGLGGLRQMLGLVYLPMRAAAIALGAFGALALMLAITGIYGVASHAVSRKSKEIGIRMAIGARPAQVLIFVFGRLGKLVSTGALLGLGLAAAGASVLASVVHQATTRDPLIIGAAAACMVLVSLVAALGPARESTSIDPVRSLRQE